MNSNIQFHKNKKRLVLLAFFCCVFLSGCSKTSQLDQKLISGTTMGTTYSVKLVIDEDAVGSASKLDALHARIEESLLAINQSMSTYISDSELNQFNRSDIASDFLVSDELCAVLLMSEQVSTQSNGAFDVTVGPLVNAWGFGPEARQNPPADELIASLMTKLGYQKLKLDCENNLIRRSQDIYVDLSAIAKGYACDVLAELIREAGYKHFMVEIGGEIYAAGSNSFSSAWRIGVEKPSLLHSGARELLSLKDVGVATSGDYRNFYEYDGIKYSHTIDPVTGKPVEHSLASVTVIADSTALADAYATALNVLGRKKGLALANSLGLAAYFIEREKDDFVVYASETFSQHRVTK